MASHSSSTAVAFITSAEAAFIADVNDRDVHRVIDEHIVPEELVQQDDGRRVARLATWLIAIYYKTEASLTAQARRFVLTSLTSELKNESAWPELLKFDSNSFERLDSVRAHWRQYQPTGAPYLRLDLSQFLDDVRSRSKEVEQALNLIESNPGILGGSPVFKGSRVPIDIVLGSLDDGVPFSRLRESYPLLTEELVRAARVYARVKPRRGRPRRLSEPLPSGWKVKSSKVVRPPEKR